MILYHVFKGGIRKFVDGSDGCPLTCGILKIIPPLQKFPKIKSEPVCLNRLEFLLNITKTHGTNVNFTFHVDFRPGRDFLCALSLKFEFNVIYEVLVFENNFDSFWVLFV